MSESNVKFNKNKYKKQYHKTGRFSMQPNLKGFLCTANNREKECLRESYNLLNKYADILYPPPVVEEQTQDSEDVGDDLAKEIASLKSETKGEKRFQSLDSGAKNILFVRTTLENPVELAQKIVEDINESKCHQTRFLIRLVPIEITCKANLTEIEKNFQPLVDKHFKGDPVKFSIVYNHRNDTGLNRDDVIKKMGEIITNTGIKHTVDLKAADTSIIVEVIRNFVFIGVVPNFIKYKKYNLLALGDNKDEPPLTTAE